MGLQAILFDLDDTLLGNKTDQFLSAYFKLLGEYAAERYEPQQLLQHLLQATQAMAADVDPARTNAEVFWHEFSRLTGYDTEEMLPFFTRFYETRFGEIQSLIRVRPEARSLVQRVFDHGCQVVIATNPMFPPLAVERRLGWAGVGVDTFSYDLVTNYENMHAAKPHPEYYAEILELLDCPAGQALMVGDDWKRDVEPAASLGIKVFWICEAQDEVPNPDVPIVGRGSLADVASWLETQGC